jgi:transposase
MKRSRGEGDDSQLAELLRLRLLEGQSIRAIARRLGVSRRTVRRRLGQGRPTPPSQAPRRGSVIDLFDGQIRRLLADTPDLKATTILERLRPLGYSSGITILRDRVRLLRPRPTREAFLTLDFARRAR